MKTALLLSYFIPTTCHHVGQVVGISYETGISYQRWRRTFLIPGFENRYSSEWRPAYH